MSPSPPRLQPTLRHLEQLMAQLLDGVILIDPSGVILSANPAALRMHGVTDLAGLGSTAEDYARRFTLWSADHLLLKQREYPLFRLLSGDSVPDVTVEVAPAGEDDVRWVHKVRDVVLDQDGGEPDCLALVISDVSDRFDAEARFAAMFRANPAPAIIVRMGDHRILQVNPGFLALTGFPPEQLVGKNLFALDLLRGVADPDTTRHSLEAGDVVAQSEAELRVADGGRRLVVFAGQPVDVTDDDALLMTFADLEPRRLAETALAASERHLSAVFEMAPVAMAITKGVDHSITATNAAFRALTGSKSDSDDATGTARLSLWPDGEQGTALQQELSKQGTLRDRGIRVSTTDGGTIDCLVSAETIGTHSILWLLQDVTKRLNRERELADAIDAVFKDASWLSRSILDKLATLRQPAPSAPAVDLTPREREILELICDNLDDGMIADRLALSRNTVRNHVARVYAKIGVNRRSGAVVWGRERGIGSSRD
ncbi:PAS domain S-box protein [Sphingomonas sp. RS2018]